MLKAIHASTVHDDAEGCTHYVNPDSINLIMLFATPNNTNSTASFALAGYMAFTTREAILSIIRRPDFIELTDGLTQEDGTTNRVLVRTSAIVQVSECSEADREDRPLRRTRIGVVGPIHNLPSNSDGLAALLPMLTQSQMRPIIWLGVQEPIDIVTAFVTKQG